MKGDAAGDQRIGSTERDAAVAALDAHREAGRLTSEEYEDRSVAAGKATFWADLDPLFADLPEPRPRPGSAVAAPAAGMPADRPEMPVPAEQDELIPDRWRAPIVALTPLVAVVLFFLTRTWLWFLLIPAVSILVYGGHGGHGGHGGGRDRDRRRGRS